MAESLDVQVSDINGSATVQGEPFFDEDESIGDQVDSLWEDVNTMLLISSFVTGCVMEGFVRDVEREVARQIAFKDEEIMLLNQKMQQHGNGSLSLSEGRDKRYDEVYSLRQQLGAISKSLLNSEWGLSVSQYNFEAAEDGPAKEDSPKVSPEIIFGDSSYLAHMDKDALIAHFNKEMNQMKRQHDSAVQEKTEEIFRLKRELLKKEGSNPWHLRNNKEFEQMRKKIGEVIAKLDGLLLENNKRTTSGIKAEEFPTQASHFASVEADHVKKIGILESDIEEARMATIIQEEIERIVVKEFVHEIKIGLHGYEMEYNMKQDICSVIQNEAVAEAMLNVNFSLLKHNEENSYRESASTLKNQEIEKLKLAVDSFNEVVREKEEFVSQIELGALKGHMNLLCHQLDSLRDKVEKQDSYISEKNREFDVIVGRLEQALQHVHYEINLSELHGRFRNATDSLKEAEKQNQILRTIIEEKEKIFISTISEEKEFKEHMKSLGESMREFENFVTDQQTAIANKVQHSELRLCLLKEQCKHLTKEGNLLKKKALCYKEISETRGSNLQKAELEVDLLGDEVEGLTDLLAKIYIALDHYSPVLQHYTGVMETLNMIKKHISIAK